MARLPNPGETNWGDVLNEYLRVSHEDDGTLKHNVVGAAQLQPASVTAEKFAATLAVHPEDFGCSVTADAATNDAAIAAAITASKLANGVVQFLGKGPYAVSQSIDHDVSKFVVRGNKTLLKVVDTFAGSYFWGMYSSAEYTYMRNQGVALSGMIISGAALGTTPTAAAAIKIGHDTYTDNCLFSLNGVYVMGFETGFRFIQNVWRVKITNSRVTGGTAISAAPGLANFGENMFFENCIIESYAPKVWLGTGEWNFINCSFNNTQIKLEGNCIAKLQQCHIEPHYTYPCISIKHAEAALILANSALVIDPAVKITNAAFEVTDGNKSQGLIIRNLDTIQSANYNPQVYGKNCVLVAGDGRVDIDGFTSNTNGYGYAIGKGANLIYNGSGEKGSTVGWSTYAIYGGTATFTADSSVYKYGGNSLKLSTNGSSIYVGQSVPCRAGQWVFAQCWNKLQIDSGTGSTSIGLDFLSSKGDVIATIGYVNTTKTTDWTCRRQLTGTSPVAPQGTASVRVYISVVGSQVTTAWYDEMIINVA